MYHYQRLISGIFSGVGHPYARWSLQSCLRDATRPLRADRPAGLFAVRSSFFVIHF